MKRERLLELAGIQLSEYETAEQRAGRLRRGGKPARAGATPAKNTNDKPLQDVLQSLDYITAYMRDGEYRSVGSEVRKIRKIIKAQLGK